MSGEGVKNGLVEVVGGVGMGGRGRAGAQDREHRAERRGERWVG